MKTYFAKYLPVEGEVKEGDKFVDNWTIDKSVRTCISFGSVKGFIDPLITDSKHLRSSPKNTKKVQLFLCSRDIQVGDKAYLRPDLQLVPTKVTSIGGRGSEMIIQGEDGTDCYLGEDNYFKVIGHISLDATWVKDGDNFEETSIKIPSRNNKFCNLNTDILIKGPCGHFH